MDNYPKYINMASDSDTESDEDEEEEDKASRILVVGDAFMDIVTCMDKLEINPGGDSLASSISLLPGGSGLNTSVRMKELGGESLNVLFFSAVGKDEQGNLLFNAVSDAGVEPHMIQSSEFATGSCIVLSTKDDRSFITNRGIIEHMASKHFEGPDGKPFKGQINKDLDHVHVAGYYNCPTLCVGIEDALSNFLECNYTTSLNPQCDAEGKYNMIDSLCRVITYLFCNEEELRAMAYGCFKAKRKTVRECALLFINAGCAHVIVTNGAKGATCFYFDIYKHGFEGDITAVNLTEVSASPPTVEVVDTTGAGDAFIAGFLASAVKSKTPKQPAEMKAKQKLLWSEGREKMKSPEYKKLEEEHRKACGDRLFDRVSKGLELGCLAGAHCCSLLGASTLDKAKLQELRSQNENDTMET